MGATRITVALRKCIQTFPFPFDEIANAKSLISEWNKAIDLCATEFGDGYTPIFNAYHSRDSNGRNIDILRSVKRKVDTVVAAAYRLHDLAENKGVALGHDFHMTKQGERWTFHPEVRREVLDRLSSVNSLRYREEASDRSAHKKGMRDSPSRKSKRKTDQPTLL